MADLKKRIGILTFHDGLNHGGFFQMYSLYNFLRIEGFSVEVINYRNTVHKKNEMRNFFFRKNVFQVLKNIRKSINFKKELKRVNLSKPCKNVDDINDLSYDAVIIGSDVVWDFKSEFLGHDPIYFSNGLSCSKILSYAPSCGTVSETDPIPEYVERGLSRFDLITVRDYSTSRLVEKVSKSKSKSNIVLDPTFLFDFDFVVPKRKVPYFLVYSHTNIESDIAQIKYFCKKNNLKLISVGYQNSWCDENDVKLGPTEWLEYFSGASYIYTSTFHGTVFSIIFKKKFLTRNNQSIKNKVQTMIDEFKLNKRLLDKDIDFESIREDIDYETTNELIMKLKCKSKDLLLEKLNNV